jgi:hypothetical protein
VVRANSALIGMRRLPCADLCERFTTKVTWVACLLLCSLCFFCFYLVPSGDPNSKYYVFTIFVVLGIPLAATYQVLA